MQLVTAITMAMKDFVENDKEFTVLNPAIVEDERGGYSYGSALNTDSEDEIAVDLSEGGFGTWEPADASEVEVAADGFARALITADGACRSAAEGTVHLYEYRGTEYVVLQDNTIITREEDNAEGPDAAFFPY